MKLKTIFFIGSLFYFLHSNSQIVLFPSTKDRLDKLENVQNSELGVKMFKEIDYQVISVTSGISRGFKFVPLLPFLPKKSVAIVHTESKELDAESKALKSVGGDILLNKRVEKTYTGVLLILWFEKVEVTGIAVKIKK